MEHLAPRGAIGQWSRGWGRSEEEELTCVCSGENLWFPGSMYVHLVP
jgi:hypothetical protein